MWSLNNIANKAAEALNSAKKGISDMAKELPPENSTDAKPDVTLQALKKQALVYRKKIEQQTEELNSYKTLIEEMIREKSDLINFKIVIGRDDGPEIIENSEVNREAIEENEKLKVKLEELGSENKGLIEEYEGKIRVLRSENENFEIKCVELQGKLQHAETLGNSYNENFLKYKQRVQQSIGGIYGVLKNSFETVGLVIPSVKVDQLGLEDLQEFIFTQAKYYEDSLKAFQVACKGTGKEGKTLEDFKNIFITILSESSQTVKSAQEKLKLNEAKMAKLLKEKEEIFKIHSKKDERIKVLIEQIGKNGEEIKLCQELKDENPRLQSQVKELKEELEKLKKINENLKESSETNTQKLQKKKTKSRKSDDCP